MKNKILNALWTFIKLIFKFIHLILNSLKFLFRIPVFSIVSMIFSIGIIIVYRSLGILLDIIFESLFNYDLSANLNFGLFDSLIAAVIFIMLNILFFNDKLKNDENFKPRKMLLYFVPTIIIWMIPLFFLQDYILDTVSFLKQTSIDLYDPTYSIFLIAFGGPHLWPVFLTGKAKAAAVGVAINSFIFVIYSLLQVEKLYSID